MAMVAQGLPLFQNSIIRFLYSSKSSLSLSQTRQAHACLLKTGISSDTHLATRLLALYANHHSFSDAYLLHASLPSPNLFSFSSLIYSLTKHSRFAEAIHVFYQMLTYPILPDTHLLPSVIKACGGLSSVRVGSQVHSMASVSGLCFDALVQSSLLHMYLQFDKLKYASYLFDTMSQPDVVECSALLSRYARKGFIEETKNLLRKAVDLGVELNLVSWNGMIAGLIIAGNVWRQPYVSEDVLRRV